MNVVLLGIELSVVVEQCGGDLRIINTSFLTEVSELIGVDIIEAFIVADECDQELTLVMYSDVGEDCYGLINDTYCFPIIVKVRRNCMKSGLPFEMKQPCYSAETEVAMREANVYD